MAHIWSVGHDLPHIPQWLALVFKSTHALAAAQKVSPVVGHRQAPIEHSCVALQRRAHAPQLAASVWRLAQLPEQFVWPVMQSTRHIPPEHTCPAPHTTPHAPQFAKSVAVFVQPLPGHKIWPVMPHAQIPSTHACPVAHMPH
jgi:hypothetical protein